jgi:hypothetical protein
LGADADQEDAFGGGGKVEGEVLAGVGGELTGLEDAAVEGRYAEMDRFGLGVVEMDRGVIDDGVGVAADRGSAGFEGEFADRRVRYVAIGICYF